MYTRSTFLLLGFFVLDYVFAETHDAEWLLKDTKCRQDLDYPSFDGWFHNLAKPDLGSSGENVINGWFGIHTDITKAESYWQEMNSRISMCRSSDSIALDLVHAKFLAFEVFNFEEPSATDCDVFFTNEVNLKINYATPYIDGDSIYGINTYSSLEPFVNRGGNISLTFLIRESSKDANLLALKLVWIEWHNLLAEILYQKCPELGKQALFNEARKFTIGTLQSVYSYDWLLKWTNIALSKYKRYDPLIDPQIERLFQAAMYLPQTLLQKIFLFNSSTMVDQRLHFGIIEKLLNKSCKEHEKYPNKFSVDSDWPDVNHARKVFSLVAYENFESFIQKNNVTHSEELLKHYEEKMEQFDALLGGILESKNGSGELFSTVLHDQFRRLRDGDRLWFENLQNVLFNKSEVDKLKKIKFKDVFYAVKKNHLNNVPKRVDSSPSNQSNVNLFYKKINYYMIFGFFFAVLLIIITYNFVKRQNSIRKSVCENAQILKHFKEKFKITSELFLAHEYDHINEPRHKVVLVLDKLKKHVIVYTLSGMIFRVIVNDVQQILYYGYQPILILKSVLSYDLIVGFENISCMNMFARELDFFLRNVNKQKKLPWRQAKKLLLSRKQYQLLLEKMFRVTFAQAFKIKHSQQEILDVGSTLATQVEYCKLTVIEFAECLGINPRSEFVTKIFSLIDRNNEGFISFRQFLDLIILFVTGKAEDKATLFFKLYDIDGIDSISKSGFKVMLSSFLSIVADVSGLDVASSIIRETNFVHKDKLALRHFLKVVSHHLQTLSRASLDVNKSLSNDKSYLSIAAKTLSSLYKNDSSNGGEIFVFDQECKRLKLSKTESKSFKMLAFFENYSKDLFGFIFPILVIFFIMTYYSYEYLQKTDIQGITEIIMVISKASSYGIVLTYGIFIISCCRNLFYTMEYLHDFFSINSLITLHSNMAYLSALFTVIHLCGYGYNVIHRQMLFGSSYEACKVQST